MLRVCTTLVACAMLVLPGCTPVRAPAVPYACEGGMRMVVRFERDHALIALPGGGGARLAQQLSGSGFRYAGEGHALAGKGRELQWTVGDAAPVGCLRVGAMPGG
jgi:membrane-bound inhibitor of C-type lysozyme